MSNRPGIYVEIVIRSDLEKVWQLTQEPALHERWDLRFSSIQYLPRPDPAEPQQFLYQTRIGFGLSIHGTGETVGTRSTENGDTTSALKFASDDPKSLIRQGSGYWRYVPVTNGLRFFTWYDYSVRFGSLGRLVDRLTFRPLIGWATAWSFDRLRLWAEEGQSPQASTAFSAIQVVARIAIATIWIWHGVVPKLLYRHIDEQTMLAQSGLPSSLLPWIGVSEIVIGLVTLCTWRCRAIFLVNIIFMVVATVAVAISSPSSLKAAFNPITLNLAMIALSVAGWLASRHAPSARRCRRTANEEKA